MPNPTAPVEQTSPPQAKEAPPVSKTIRTIRFRDEDISGKIKRAWLLREMRPNGGSGSFSPRNARIAGYAVAHAKEAELKGYRWLAVEMDLTTKSKSAVVPFESVSLDGVEMKGAATGLAVMNPAAPDFSEFATLSFPSQKFFKVQEHAKDKLRSQLLFETVSLTGSMVLGTEAMKFARPGTYEVTLLFVVPNGKYTIGGVPATEV